VTFMLELSAGEGGLEWEIQVLLAWIDTPFGVCMHSPTRQARYAR
jgi:hypothetical protein